MEPQLTPAWGRVPEDDAMETDSRSGWQEKSALEELWRERIRATIEAIVDEELAERWAPPIPPGWVRYAPVTDTASAHVR